VPALPYLFFKNQAVSLLDGAAMSAAQNQIREGFILDGRYQIEEMLQLGEMENAYTCRDLDVSNTKLIAKILFSVTGDSGSAGSSCRELSLLRRLRHPNLVRILDFGIIEGAGSLFLIEELVEGMDVYAGTESMDLEGVLNLIVGISRALQYLHACGVVHGALKSSNAILLEQRKESERFKLLDFGLGHFAGSMTHQNGQGMLAYTAPEVLLGGPANACSDVYSLGVLAYQLLTRRLPFDDEDRGFLIQKHLQGNVDFHPIENLKNAGCMPQLISRMLEKDPLKRPALEAVIEQASGALSHNGLAAGMSESERLFPATEFVGREREMALLQECARQVRDNGRGRTFFIAGEAGSGKSRCMEELRNWALLEGWRVVEGICRAGRESAYEPYRQILARTELTNGKAIFRFGETLHIAEAGAFDGYSEFAAGQFHDLLTRELVRHLVERPTILFLHDFHLADEATCMVLDYLSSDIQAHPIFMCVSFRPGEDSKGILNKIVELMLRQDRGELMALEPLTKESVERLVAGMTANSRLKETLGSWIFNSVGGNPFFLEEMLKHLVEQGVLYRESGQWKINERDLNHLEIPTSVGIVLQRRLIQLSPSARELVNWMSLFRRPATPGLLKSVMSQRSGNISEALQELTKRQMIKVEIKSAEEIVDFNHSLIAEVIREKLPKLQRTKMHRRIAEVLESECIVKGNFTELAMHYIEGKSKDSSIRHVLTAASQYRAEFAHENALRCYEYAFKNRSYLTGMALCSAAIEASDTMFALGLSNRAVRLLKTEMRSDSNIGAGFPARMYMQLALAYQHIGDLHMQEMSCKRGLKFIENQPSAETNLTKAMLWAELAFGEAMRSRPQKGLMYLDNALKACSSLGATILEGRIQNLSASLYRVACDLRSARLAGESAMAILWDSGESYLACSAYSTLGGILMGLGRFLPAQEKHEYAVSLSDKSRSVVSKSQALGNLAECLCRMGRIQEAQNAVDRALKSVCESNNPAISYAFNTIWAEIRFAAGDYRSAFQILEKLSEDGGHNLAAMTVGHAHYVAASLSFYLGNFQESLKHIQLISSKNTLNVPLYEYELAEALRARILFEQGACQKALNNLYSLDKRVALKHWPYHRCIIKLQIAELLIKQQRKAIALKYAANALRLAKAMQALPLISHCHLLLGLIYSPLHRSIGNNCQLNSIESIAGEDPSSKRAIEELQLCCQKAESASEIDKQWHAHAELSLIYKSLGDEENGLIHARKAYELLGKLEDQIPSEMLSSFYAAFDRGHIKLELVRIIESGRDLESNRHHPATQFHADKNARVLLRVSAAVNSIQKLNPLLDAIFDQLIPAINVERAFVFLGDKSSKGMDLAEGRNSSRQSLFEASSISRQILETVYSKGEPIISGNASSDPRWKNETAMRNTVGKLLCAPLKASGRVLGVLYADHPAAAEDLNESTINLFAAVCNLAGLALENALIRQQLPSEKGGSESHLIPEKERYPEIVGKSASIEALRDRIGLAAASPLDILITGESGTGKELVARAIYRTGRRKSGKFIAVDCGSLSDTLAEAELFGYRKGAFTGAVENRQGLLESAHKGIIFFDEISNMPFRLQAKLLRVLQEREVRPIGETLPRKIDIQVIAASNKNLQSEMNAGRFRKDLFYRLKAMEIHVPSLRERSEDIPLLIEWFLGKTAEMENGRSKRFKPEALDLLKKYFYPGNIRELKNIIAGSYYSTKASGIGAEDLPPELRCEDQGEMRSETNMAGRIYREILEGRGSFEDLVKEPFLEHQFGSSIVRSVVHRALKDTAGKYRDALVRLRVPDRHYSSMIQFLKRNKCYLDFRSFRRSRGTPADRAEAAS
jgi:Nif-specific regulatory protein